MRSEKISKTRTFYLNWIDAVLNGLGLNGGVLISDDPIKIDTIKSLRD